MFQLKLKELRETQGLSQADFAKRLGVSQSTVGMWECGRNKPTYAMLVRIANFFHVNLDTLTDLVEQPCMASSEPAVHSTCVVYTTNAKSKLNQDTFTLTMPDASLEPLIHKNDILTVRSIKEIHNDELVAFQYQNSVFVRFTLNYEDNWLLYSPKKLCTPLLYSPSNSDIQIMGKVIALHRNLEYLPKT